MWLYLEMGPLKRYLRLNEVIEVDPNAIWLVSSQEEENRTQNGDGHVKTQKESGHLESKERSSEEAKPTNTLILDFWSQELRENEFLFFKPPSLVVFYYSSPNKLI